MPAHQFCCWTANPCPSHTILTCRILWDPCPQIPYSATMAYPRKISSVNYYQPWHSLSRWYLHRDIWNCLNGKRMDGKCLENTRTHLSTHINVHRKNITQWLDKLESQQHKLFFTLKHCFHVNTIPQSID